MKRSLILLALLLSTSAQAGEVTIHSSDGTVRHFQCDQSGCEQFQRFMVPRINGVPIKVPQPNPPQRKGETL